jgi:hypothetical protein
MKDAPTKVELPYWKVPLPADDSFVARTRANIAEADRRAKEILMGDKKPDFTGCFKASPAWWWHRAWETFNRQEVTNGKH